MASVGVQRLLGPVFTVVLGVGIFGGCGGEDPAELTIEAVSSRPEAVSGEDVLVAVGGAGTNPVRLSLDGTDVTSSARAVDAGDQTIALVGGLSPGPHTIVASAGSASATLRIEAHPTSGPIFSGPQLPMRCTTEAAGLGPALDADCSAASEVTWLYGTRDGRVRPLRDPSAPPADAARVRLRGEEVPFVVRVERGTIDRAIYTIAVLAPDGEPTHTRANPAWNRRLVYRFHGGCETPFSQGETGLLIDLFDRDLIGAGYAVATSTLNVLANGCNDVVSAEAMSMVSERVAELLGPPALTIGHGTSGGAIQQFLIAQNYPGLLDGIVANSPFPDMVTVLSGALDCRLLVHWYETAGSAWTEIQRAAVNGHETSGTCLAWDSDFGGLVDPSDGCDPGWPAEAIYSPANPDGLRCTYQDANSALFGIDPEIGISNRPLSNVGVQYGLDALNEAVISVEQFLELNQGIGGFDIDGSIVPERMSAGEEVMQRAYAGGRVMSAAEQLAKIPILITTRYTDELGYDVHDHFRVLSIAERLGEGANLVVRTFPPPPPPAGKDAYLERFLSPEGIVLMDRWLSAGAPPPEAIDSCTAPDGTVHSGPGVLTDGPCASVYPPHGDPRTAAGAPLSNDILACSLAPPQPGDYAVSFDPGEWQRLLATFPDGVCDWTAPGIGQVELEGTWLEFGAESG